MPKKPGLGRGLESLLGETNVEVNRPQEDSSKLPIDQLQPNPDQPRKEFNPKELSELSDSIAQNGVLQPLLVRKKGDKYQIVAGERRYQASKLAGLKEVPVVINNDIDDNEVLKLALIENLQRADLNPIEEALGYRQLLDEQSLTQAELGELLSKSRSAVTNTLRLLDLPKPVQELMAQGLLTAGHARAILAVPTEEGRVKLANKVVADKLSVRQTESLAPLYSGMTVERPVRQPTPQSYKRVARKLRMALDTNVRVKQVRGKNKIEIDFKDEDDLVRIVTSLMSAENDE